MAEEVHTLKQTRQRAGIFDGRSIYATQHENEQGQLGWLIMTWPEDGDPLDSYWLGNGKLWNIAFTDWLFRGIKIGDVVTEIEPPISDLILSTIAKWEKEEQEKSLYL
jgi:hypothetical protein